MLLHEENTKTEIFRVEFFEKSEFFGFLGNFGCVTSTIYTIKSDDAETKKFF